MWFGADAWALAALPVFAALPLRCSIVAPPRDEPPRDEISAVEPKQEAPAPRVASEPPAPPPRAIALPEEVVVRTLATGQTAFLGCWARALKTDVGIASKVQLHIELAADGTVLAASSDSDSPALARCLAVVARHLPFPRPGQLAIVDLPLIFH